jgi:hypothetical protein
MCSVVKRDVFVVLNSIATRLLAHTKSIFVCVCLLLQDLCATRDDASI